MLRIILVFSVLSSLFLISTWGSIAGEIPMPIPGACCFITNPFTCEFVDEQTCVLGLEGEFQGEGVTCEPNPCFEPPPTPTPTATPEPEEPIIIIPTMGQWGMILATMILGLFAVLKLRREA